MKIPSQAAQRAPLPLVRPRAFAVFSLFIGIYCICRADTPIAAYSICNNVGIVARFGFNGATGQAYRDHQAVLADAVADAGCRHIRSAVSAGFEADMLDALNGNGRNILLCAVVSQTTGSGSLDYSQTGVATALNRLQTIRAANRLRYLEGPNEWNGNGPPATWAPELANFQRQLYAAAEQGLNNQVIGSYAAYSVVQAAVAGGSTGDDFQTYADALAQVTGTKANWGSGHIYGGSATSYETRFENNLDRLQAIPPGEPFVLTETGLSTTAGVGLTVNEEVKGKYLARWFVDVAQRRPSIIRSSYYFELYEAATNSGAATTMGLIENGTLVRKRSFYVFRNMLWLLGSDDASNLTAVGVTVSNGAVQRQLVRRADGVYLLCLWMDNTLWSSNAPVSDPDINVNVTITGQANRTVRVYRPSGIGWNDSGTCSGRNQPTATLTTDGSGVLTNVPVNGGMTVLEFKTGTNSLPAVRTLPPAWTPGL